jgi:hypothetical protein
MEPDMTEPTSTPAFPEDPRPRTDAGGIRRGTLGEAVVARMTPQQIAAAAAPVDRALASIAAAAGPSLAPLAAQAEQAVANLVRVSYHRPPLAVQSSLEATTAAIVAAAAPAMAELATIAGVVTAAQAAQDAVAQAVGTVSFARYAGWSSPVTEKLLAVDADATAALWGVRSAAEHVLAAEHAAASLLASTNLAAAAEAALRAVRLPTIVMPEFVSFTLPGLAAVQEQLAGLLRTWRHELDGDTRVAQSPAYRALIAAEAAVRALERGDWQPVRAFVRRWLGLFPTPAVLDAAVEVLLEPGWDTFWDLDESLTGDRPLALLRARVRSGARSDQPLWERQAAGRKVALLGEPVRGMGADGVTLGDLVAVKPQPDRLGWGFDDDRLRIVWSLMTERDRDVATELAAGAPNWADAAVAAGYSPAVGEAVRKRRLRLIAEADRRLGAR